MRYLKDINSVWPSLICTLLNFEGRSDVPKDVKIVCRDVKNKAEE